MHTHRVSKVQSILLPKNKFRNEREAMHHVEKMGYNAHYKEKPDDKGNFYRFRQKAPSEKHDYRTIHIGKRGSEAVVETPILGKDGHGQLQEQYRKPLGSDPATWTPKYLQKGNHSTMLTPADMHMQDKQGNLKAYRNIHDMQEKGLEYKPTTYDTYKRNTNMPFSINKKKHEMMQLPLPTNIGGGLGQIMANKGGVPGLSN